MTTILKALQLEASELSAKQLGPTDRRWRSRWPWVAAPLLAFVGGALLWFGRESRVERPAAIFNSSVAAREKAPAPTPLSPSIEAEPPWGRVEERKFAPASSAISRAARKPIAQFASKAPARAAVTVTTTGATVHGGTRIQLKSIDYSQDTGRRSVTLMIEGGGAVTLHEGESAQGVEVQLILPRMVYLHQGSTVFALSGGA